VSNPATTLQLNQIPPRVGTLHNIPLFLLKKTIALVIAVPGVGVEIIIAVPQVGVQKS